MWHPKNNTLCFKPLKTLLTKCGGRDVCKEDQVLIIDEGITKILSLLVFFHSHIWIRKDLRELQMEALETLQ